MKQFLFGIVVSALAWWGYTAWRGDEAAAKTGAGNPGPATGGPAGAAGPTKAGGLGAMLHGDDASAVPPRTASGANDGPLTAREPAPAATPAHEPAALPAAALRGDVDVADTVAKARANDPTALRHAYTALALGIGGNARQQLVDAVARPVDDFATGLAGLGQDNSFLHSADGRAQATKVLAAAMALPDPEALAAGSQLLALCLRGRIDKGDTVQRAFVDEAYKQHRVRVDRWLCNPANVAGARSYTIGSGEVLAKVATKFRKEGILVEDGLLALLNRISNPNVVQVGQKVKVPIEPVMAVLEKRSYGLAVYVGESLLRLYWVGHGADDHTPVTDFKVVAKQEHPEWTAPNGQRIPYGHPDNILGEYFIKFGHDSYTGYGAHGTPMPETICTMSSAGCIRMLAPDIAELFKILPRGATVRVLAHESLTK